MHLFRRFPLPARRLARRGSPSFTSSSPGTPLADPAAGGPAQIPTGNSRSKGVLRIRAREPSHGGVAGQRERRTLMSTRKALLLVGLAVALAGCTGKDGSSCTVRDNGNGTKTLRCED